MEHSVSTMPALFIGHGTPMNALEHNQFTRDWCALNQQTPKPKAILCISAHWLTQGLFVTAQPSPTTIHDFGGFPQALFNCQYPCPGSAALTARVQQLTGATASADWGLDHGSWVPLMHLYPKADIPVVQLSLDISRSNQAHYALAKQLQPLRDEGVLMLSSGNIVHNIAKWMSDPHGPFDYAREFNQAIVDAANAGDYQAVIDYEQHPYANDAVPHPDHYWPLLYTLAQQREGEALTVSEFAEQTLETCSMTSLRVG